MGYLWKHPQCKNWFARFLDGRGIRITRSTGTSDRGKAEDVLKGWEHLGRMEREQRLTVAGVLKVADEVIRRISDNPHSSVSPPLDAFLLDWLDQGNGLRKETTLRSYRASVTSFLDYLGSRRSVPINTLLPGDLQKFVKSRIDLKMSSKTIHNTIRTLSTAFTESLPLILLCLLLFLACRTSQKPFQRMSGWIFRSPPERPCPSGSGPRPRDLSITQAFRGPISTPWLRTERSGPVH
jgi:hypothetical protein